MSTPVPVPFFPAKERVSPSSTSLRLPSLEGKSGRSDRFPKAGVRLSCDSHARSALRPCSPASSLERVCPRTLSVRAPPTNTMSGGIQSTRIGGRPQAVLHPSGNRGADLIETIRLERLSTQLADKLDGNCSCCKADRRVWIW